MWQPGFWKTHPFTEGFGHSSGVVSAAVVSLAMPVEEFQKLAQTVLLMAYLQFAGQAVEYLKELKELATNPACSGLIQESCKELKLFGEN